MIDYSGAVTYFAEHVKGHIFQDAGETAGTQAIAHGRRQLARALGRAMSDTEAAYSEGDTTRDEYAVYEQALYLIENGVIANGEGSAPLAVVSGGGEQPDGRRQAEAAVYAPEALRWLGYRGAVVTQG